MNCRHLQDYLEAYVRNELDAEHEKQVAAHLSHCDNCRSLHDAIFVIHIALKELPSHRARADFNLRTMQKFDQLQAAQNTARRVEEVAHAATPSPWRRVFLWFDSLLPRGVFRFAHPAMIGMVVGLAITIAVILSPHGQKTMNVVAQQASGLSWWNKTAPNHWPTATPPALPTPTPQSSRWDE